MDKKIIFGLVAMFGILCSPLFYIYFSLVGKVPAYAIIWMMSLYGFMPFILLMSFLEEVVFDATPTTTKRKE